MTKPTPVKARDLSSPKGLLSEAVRIGRGFARLTEDTQTFLLAAFVHAGTTGDAMAVSRMLYEAGGASGARVKAIVAYVEAFTPIRLDLKQRDDKSRSVKVHLTKGWKPEDFRMDDAVKHKWNEFTEERDPSVQGLEAFLKALARTSKADKPGKDGQVRATHEAAAAAALAHAYLSSEAVQADIRRLAALAEQAEAQADAA